MRTWIKARKKNQHAPNDPLSVQSTTGTTSVLCASWECGKPRQKHAIGKGKACYTKGQYICNSIWKKAEQGMKTWVKA